jgi:hypothetical protein
MMAIWGDDDDDDDVMVKVFFLLKYDIVSRAVTME